MITTLIGQILVMFALMMVGVFLRKAQLISQTTVQDFGGILVRVILPVVIVRSFLVESTPAIRLEMILAGVLSCAAMAVAMVLSSLCFSPQYPAEKFAAFVCNAGFIGIPLVKAALGDEMVLYVGLLIGINNLAMWTYGVFALTGDCRNIRPKKVFLGPGVQSIVIGLVLFFTGIPLPTFVLQTMDHISALSTPVAMLLLGAYLAKTNLAASLRRPILIKCVLCRLLLMPLATLAVFAMIPWGSDALKTALLIAVATPVGSNVVVFSSHYCEDHETATQAICLSTLLCLVTLPMISKLAELVF